MKIVEIMEDSPAKESELDVGDIIVAVNGNDILTLGYSESIDMIRRGKVGTTLKLTVRKNGVDKEYEFTRKSINLITASGKMLDNNIGYIGSILYSIGYQHRKKKHQLSHIFIYQYCCKLGSKYLP